MRSPDDLAERARHLWQRLSPSNPQPLSALETFEAMAQLRLLSWLLDQTLDDLAPLPPLSPPSPAEAGAAIRDETTAESRADLGRYATLVTQPVLRAFGHPSVLALALPPLDDPRCGHPTVSTFVSRAQAWQLQQVRVPDPWSQPVHPAASAVQRVPNRSR